MADVTTCDVGATLAEPSVRFLNNANTSSKKYASFVKAALYTAEAIIWRRCECFH
jgi:hypothetical protein